jgi:hypothetical protein
MVAVVGSKRHVGADHLVICQPDRTLALLPVWMTDPTAASYQLVSSPRLSIESLAEVRALIDALLASSGRESPRREVRGQDDRSGSSARPSGEADPACSGPADGGGRRRPAAQDNKRGRSGGRR